MLACAGLAVLAGCGGQTKVTEIPAQPAQAPSEYKIGPGCAAVFVVEPPGSAVPVRPDGVISTPLIQGVPAEGKTPPELAKDLEKALSEYVRNPTVSVMVTSFVGAYADQVRVVGQAAKPQSLSFRANMTVLDVMIAVGGLAEFAAGNRAVLVRQENGKQLRIPVRLNDLLDVGHFGQHADASRRRPIIPGRF
jgi:polysaccharide export outer membrane protein